MTASDADGAAATHVSELTSPEFLANPYPAFARLLASEAPVFVEAERAWFVSRYDDVAAVLRDPRLSKREQASQTSLLSQSMLFQDPPNHTRLRNLVSAAFAPARVRAMEPRIAAIADAILDRVAARGRMDFMAEFALPLPVAVMSDLLGIAEEDWADLHRWSASFVVSGPAGADGDAIRRAQGDAIASMTDYFRRHIEALRTRPRNDLITALVDAHDSQGRLTTDEIIGTCMLLLIAGHETTMNLLGNGLFTLLRHPSQYARLREAPDLVPAAVEEMLRYESPVQRSTFRMTMEPFDIGGRTIEAGSAVVALIGAANRDPAVFPAPDRFDIERAPNRHLAFGVGIHACLGAALARTEARIGFTRAFARLGEMRFAATQPDSLLSGLRRALGLSTSRKTPPFRWRPSTMVRGLQTLPVEWSRC
jgi:cytochrome P450